MKRGQGAEVRAEKGFEAKGSRRVLTLGFFASSFITSYIYGTEKHNDDEQHHISLQSPGRHVPTKATQKNGPRDVIVDISWT